MTVKFDSDHDNPKDCQLIVCITGSREYIREQLHKLLIDDAKAGKPGQGVISHAGSGNIQVITPVWKGKKY